jgi:hypothetical protein
MAGSGMACPLLRVERDRLDGVTRSAHDRLPLRPGGAWVEKLVYVERYWSFHSRDEGKGAARLH